MYYTARSPTCERISPEHPGWCPLMDSRPAQQQAFWQPSELHWGLQDSAPDWKAVERLHQRRQGHSQRGRWRADLQGMLLGVHPETLAQENNSHMGIFDNCKSTLHRADALGSWGRFEEYAGHSLNYLDPALNDSVQMWCLHELILMMDKHYSKTIPARFKQNILQYHW